MNVDKSYRPSGPRNCNITVFDYSKVVQKYIVFRYGDEEESIESELEHVCIIS